MKKNPIIENALETAFDGIPGVQLIDMQEIYTQIHASILPNIKKIARANLNSAYYNLEHARETLPNDIVDDFKAILEGCAEWAKKDKGNQVDCHTSNPIYTNRYLLKSKNVSVKSVKIGTDYLLHELKEDTRVMVLYDCSGDYSTTVNDITKYFKNIFKLRSNANNIVVSRYMFNIDSNYVTIYVVRIIDVNDNSMSKVLQRLIKLMRDYNDAELNSDNLEQVEIDAREYRQIVKQIGIAVDAKNVTKCLLEERFPIYYSSPIESIYSNSQFYTVKELFKSACVRCANRERSDTSSLYHPTMLINFNDEKCRFDRTYRSITLTGTLLDFLNMKIAFYRWYDQNIQSWNCIDEED